MKKLMALCLAMLMALSMVSFSVMAEDEVAPATFADIANGQPAAFVTGNLSLGEHTITSSNEAFIATDGTVTRPLFEDAKVTLTINGGEAVEVTVKAKSTNVLYSTDFSTADVPTEVASKSFKFASYPEWSISTAVNDTAISGGKLYADHGITDDDKGYVYIYAPTKSASVTTNPVTYSFTMSDLANIATGIDVRISGSWYDADGTKLKDFSNQTIARCNTLNGFGSYGFTTGVSASKDFTFKYDPVTGAAWMNGKRCEATSSGAGEKYSLMGLVSWNKNANTGVVTEVRAPENAATVKITHLLLVDAASTAKGEYKLDDYVVYEDVPAADVLATATPAEKAAYYAPYLEKAYIAPTADFTALTSNLNLTPDEELAPGVSITWTSSNPAVIPASGVLNRPMEGETAVTLTGTLAVDGAEPVVKTYSINVLPLTVAYKSEIADAESLTANTSFVGATGWTSSINTWERMDVGQDADGNKFYSICASAYQPSGTSPKYTFQTVPTYTTGETFVFEARVRIPVKAGLANWGFLLNGYEMAEFIYYNGYLYDNDYDLGSDGYYGAGSARTDKSVTANTWYNIKLEVYKNAEGSFVKCYIDNKLVGTHKTRNAIPATITSAQFQFTGRSNMDNIGPDKDHPDRQPTTPVNFFHVDDIRLTKKIKDEAAVQLLADADKVAYYKKLINANPITEAKVVGETFHLDSAYELMNSATTGVTVAWASSNPAYITNEGEVLKLTTADAPVTGNLTATITAGDVTDTVVFPVRIGDGTTLVDSADYNTSEGTVGNASYVQDSAEHGTVLYMSNPKAGTHKQQGFENVHGTTRGNRVFLEADVKYRRLDAAGVGGFTFNLIAGRLSAYVSLNYNSKMIGVNTTYASINTAGAGLAVEAKTIYYPMPASVIAKGEGEWVHIAVDHNSMSQSLYVYVDGVLLNELPLLQADMDLGGNGGNAVRGYSIQLSGAGEMWVDNVSLRKFDDTKEAEVDAALNAALIDFASDIYNPTLTNCELPAMTIGKSWISGDRFIRDLTETNTVKPSNVSTYTYVTDGPAITWTVDGKPATEINVTSPKTVTITVTATKDGVSKSKTFTKKVAPVAIQGLALGTADCLNGAWVEGATGTEKLVMAFYQDEKLVRATVIDFAEEGAWDAKTGTGNRFNADLGIVHDLGTANPKVTAEYDQIKLFIVAADGITPLALANTDLHD